MKRWQEQVMILLVALGLALLPLVGFAQGSDAATGGSIFRLNGLARVGSAESVDSVGVINGDAMIAGIVRQTVFVLNGNAVVSGLVDGDLNVANGHLTLEPGAQVHNVMLYQSELTRQSGATVSGTISHPSPHVMPGWPVANVFSFAGWIGTTLLTLFAGLLAATVAGRQLTRAGRLITEQPGPITVTALVVAVGLPVLAILTMITIIGIPLGLGMLLLIPIIAFLGYLVVATRLGVELVPRLGQVDQADRPYWAVVLGVLALRLLELIPVLGGLVALVAGSASRRCGSLGAGWNAGPDKLRRRERCLVVGLAIFEARRPL